MIETGIVKEKLAGGRVRVGFEHLETEAECEVLQPTTGGNNVFVLPSVGSQVVCSLEAGRTIVLGAVFSEEEKIPEGADRDGELRQFEDAVCKLKKGTAGIYQGSAALELSGGKATLKNGESSLKEVLTKILNTVKGLTVTTPVGPSGTPLPPTIAAVTECEQLVEKLFNP